ncbi:MAG: hypothetical protein R3263_11460 [Myxococcota bacterium]|nr:hypothetical protein [Myxococcota bacterium]
MPQSLYSLLALVIAMLLAVHQHRTTAAEQQTMLRGEMEMMASAAAQDVMATIAAHPFDAALLDPAYDMASFSTGDLAPWPFESERTYEEARALEDFDGTSTEVALSLGELSFTFTAEVAVRYLDAHGRRAASQTDTKEVAVTVTHPLYPAPLARLARSFAP